MRDPATLTALEGPLGDPSSSTTVADVRATGPIASALGSSSALIAPEPSATPSTLTQAELDGASTVAALEPLSEKHPTDARVWRKLAKAYDDRSSEKAITAVRRL